MIALCPAQILWNLVHAPLIGILGPLKVTNILIVNNSAAYLPIVFKFGRLQVAMRPRKLRNYEHGLPVKSKMAESGPSAKITSVFVPHLYCHSSRFKMEQDMWSLKGGLTHRWMSYLVPKFNLVRSTTPWVSARWYWKKRKKKMKNSEFKLGKSSVSGILLDFAHIWCTVWARDSRCAINVGGQEVKGEGHRVT